MEILLVALMLSYSFGYTDEWVKACLEETPEGSSTCRLSTVFQERYCPILDRRRSGLATSIILSIGIMAVIVVGHLFSRRTERDAKQKHEKTGDEEEAAKRERKNKCQSMLKVQHKFE
eukprot:TRINITY_DN14634_c0_g1_i13.p1 TRINITY_DN14634_c0_g1~~TRINITY_DN14634_c0_g1_i13.p1  ORF type:complete len:118 (-),score=14.12 TRINITY_DN14634_c0_g1_i13:94-447(-)